jgi:TadE-like protein
MVAMARMSNKRASGFNERGLGERGAVYVEFLIVFMPLFFLFLAVCQFALLAAARLIVQHAALSGARSAIVVLEDDPRRYGDAPRGSLSKGETTTAPSIEQALASFVALPSWAHSGALGQAQGPQHGARMASIREAAEFPLLALAPREDAIARPQDGSVASSLGASVAGQLVFAVGYTRAAAVITVHASGSDELASEPVEPNAAVSVHVTYLYSCGVPIVRALICRSLSSWLGPPGSSLWSLFGGGDRTSLGKRFDLAEDRGGLERLAGPGSFFAPLSGEATLPNQGAAYEDAGKS